MRIFGHCNVCPHSVVRNLNPDFSLSLENSKDLWHSHHLEQISASMLWQMCTLRFSTVCTVLCGLTLACFAHLYGIPAFGAFGLLSLNICSRFLCWGKRTCREVTQCWNRWPWCAVTERMLKLSVFLLVPPGYGGRSNTFTKKHSPTWSNCCKVITSLYVQPGWRA